jgi:hypothetical protein
MRPLRTWRTLPVVLDILVLALGAAFYPTLLAIVLVVLTRPSPGRLLCAYLAGGSLAGLGIGFVVVFGLQGAGVNTISHETTAGALLDILAGVLSLALAFLLARGRDPRPARLRHRPRPPKDPGEPSWTKRAVQHDSLPVAFGLGIVLNLPSLWYLIALKDIASGPYSTTEQVLLILMVNVIMFAVIEIPLVAYILSPDRAAARVHALNAWIRSHARRIAEVIAAALGVYLAVKGVAAL